MKKLLTAAALFALGLYAKPAAAYPAYGTVQISTNTTYAPTLQAGAIKIASGTINALVVSTLTVNGNAVVTGTTTSGAFSGSGASLTSLPAANLTGNVAAGALGNAILLQATLQTGATFFVSSGTVNNVNVSTLSVVGNQGYVLFYSSMVCTSPTTATTKSSYAVYVATITITPKRTTSRIKVTANAGMRSGDTALTAVYETLFRNSTNLASAFGSTATNLCEMKTAASSATSYVPCFMQIWDMPATTSSINYTIGLANSDNSTTVQANQTSQTVCISVEEWGY